MRQLITLGVVSWIGIIRGWSFTTLGLRPTWKWTGAGIVVFLAFLGIQRLLGLLMRGFFHTAVDFHRVSNLTIPFVILISIVNPVFEETIEVGYFFQALQLHGMWLTFFASAAFRGFLHLTMSASGFVFMFAEGCFTGFSIGDGVSYGRSSLLMGSKCYMPYSPKFEKTANPRSEAS